MKNTKNNNDAPVNSLNPFFKTAKPRATLDKPRELTTLEKCDYETLLNYTGDLLWSINTDYKLIAANNAFYQHIEDSAGIIIKPGDDILMKAFFPEDFTAFWEAGYTRALAGESFKAEVYAPVFLNSKASWTETNFNPVYKEDTITGVACYSRDITERKKAEKVLQAAYTENNTILERIDDGFFAIDKNSIVIYWNKKAEILLNKKKEDIFGKNLHEVFAPTGSVKFYDHYQKAINENTSVHFEEFSVRTNKWFAVSAYASVNGLSVYFKDITEQKIATEKLKESELRYRSLIDQAMDTICITDASLKFIEVNPSGCRMFGYSKEEFLQLFVTDVLFEEDLKSNPVKTEDLLSGKAVNNERRIKRKDGTAMEVELNGKMLEDGRIMIFGRDISERKEAEQLIKESEAKYRSFFESSMDGILITVTDGEILSANPAACEIFKMTEAEICRAGRFGIADITDPRLNILITERRQTGKVKGELTLIRKDGSRFEADLTSAVFTDALGQSRTSMIVRDITERKKAADKLTESELRYRSIIEQATDAICIADANMKIMDINPYGCQMLNYSKEEFLQLSIVDLFVKEDLISNPFRLDELKSGKIMRSERRFRQKNGSLIDVEISAKILEDGRYIVFGHDIADRKTAENKLKQSEAKYRTLFEQNMAGVYQSTLSGKILNCNQAFAKMLKYDSPVEILQINASELYFSQNDRIEFTENVIHQKNLNNYESVLKCKDGSPLYFIENISLRKDEVTGEAFFDGIIIDISEKKEAEFQLKESNERYNLISQATNDMVWDWDLVTGKVYRNKEGWKKIFKTGDNDIENEFIDDWDNRVHPDDQEIVKLVEDEIQKSEKDFFEVECRVLRDDGTYAYIHDRGNILRNEQGKAVRLIGATQDITKRKEAELQVAKSELRFRSLVQNGSDLVGILDNRGYYLYSSPAVKRILGYEPEFMIGKNSFSFIHPEDINNIKKHLAKKKDKDHLQTFDFRFKNAAGEWRWLESKVTDMSNNPEISGYIFNSRDITEKVLLEIELENQRLIKQKEITEAVISAQEQERQELGGELHDNINQILAGSQLYLRLAKKELDIEHPYLTETDSLISSAIDEIRTLSHSLIPPSLTESELLGALSNLIETTRKSSNMAISLQSYGFDECSLPDKLKLNIYRIVQEQINNILKHAKAQKAIVRLTQDNEKILLTIKDDGVGFDTTEKATGVGLMNIKTRASLFNGEVTIISAPGRGCELRVLFN